MALQHNTPSLSCNATLPPTHPSTTKHNTKNTSIRQLHYRPKNTRAHHQQHNATQNITTQYTNSLLPSPPLSHPERTQEHIIDIQPHKPPSFSCNTSPIIQRHIITNTTPQPLIISSIITPTTQAHTVTNTKPQQPSFPTPTFQHSHTSPLHHNTPHHHPMTTTPITTTSPLHQSLPYIKHPQHHDTHLSFSSLSPSSSPFPWYE